jgi:hypothetical protein
MFNKSNNSHLHLLLINIVTEQVVSKTRSSRHVAL